MKQRLLLSLLLLTITSDILSSNGNSGSFFNNELVKMLLYPFRTFWNSSRATKVTIGAVGALLIGSQILSWMRKQTINMQLDAIDKKITFLKKSLKAEKNKEKVKQTLMTEQRKVVPEKSLETLMNEITNLIFAVYRVYKETLSTNQRTRLEQLSNTFNTLESEALTIINNNG